jgi:hypothetical protein
MSRHDDAQRSQIAGLLKNRKGSSTTQEIRDGLSEVIKEAAAGKDVDTLALLAAWFVLVSEDITIARFRMWMEHGRLNDTSEPPTNGRGGQYG